MYKLLISLLILTGCGVDGQTRTSFIPGNPKAASDVESCTVVQEINQAVILCPDGSTAIIKNGKDGEDGQRGIKGDAGERGETGEAGPIGDGGKDGINGQDGKDGTDGIDGTDGVDGIDAEPCTVYRVNNRTVRIECPDGSFEDIRTR